MKVTFSRDEFRTLLDLVYLGGWMANSHRLPDQQVTRLEQIEQRIYALAGQFGLSDLVEFDEQSRRFFPTAALSDPLDEYISAYDEEAFWDGLIDALAYRDFHAMYGDAAEAMTGEQRLDKLQPFLDRYEKAFEEGGIEHLRLAEL